MHTYVYDTEVYPNYFLVSFLNLDTGEVLHFDMWPECGYNEDGVIDPPIPGRKLDISEVRRIFQHDTVISFNGRNFDLPIVTEALRGADCAKLKRISDKIIKNNVKWWTLDIEPIVCNHIDIIDVAPGIASLKIYGGRLHCPTMQDLPIDPDDFITAVDRVNLRAYCENDLRTTATLYRKLLPQIQLRERMGDDYHLDLRSKSDAQIAEAVIKSEVEAMTGRKLTKPEVNPGDTFRYVAPKFVKFTTDVMRSALSVVTGADFTIGYNGAVEMPAEVEKLKIAIGSGVYRMGIGGLHSSEKCVAHVSDDENILVDRDVTSYYPSIILNCGLRPKHMGTAFTTVYKSLVDRRIEAKRAGDTVTADALKITINGSFGKFGSPYSILYSPTLLIQTTITGQLSLLMLIEMLEVAGISVVSANTDGIVIKCQRSRQWEMEAVIWKWEAATGFGTEETEYLSIHSRDVNNYIAVKKGGGVKLKGVYAPAALQKNPTSEIAVVAAVKLLVNGTPVADTINQCSDITKFVNVRQVKGGAVKDKQYLGRAVRWYYAKGETGTITYKVNGYKVPRTEGANPMMTLPDGVPDDLDRDWYITEANSILKDVGYRKD